jgi:predicted O-methyltransferase YrrM
VNSRAIKAGVAEASRISAIDHLVGGDERFRSIWTTTGHVPGQFSELNAAAMFTVLVEVRPQRIVEIGSYLGRSTTFLASVLRIVGGTEVVAIDPHTGDRQLLESIGARALPSFDLFETHIASMGVQDLVTPIVKPSAEAAVGWDRPIDLLYIDGWHSYEAVIEDGRAWLPHLSPTGVVFFDDYSRYREVHEAVTQLADTNHFRLWGNSFGQAFGGRGDPSPAASKVLRETRRPWTRWQYRSRDG